MIRKTILWQALILIICALVVSSCSGKKPQATGAGESNLLATIKSAGVIHVGTMASNAPWVYKDEKDNYVGYDMDLIQEIARRLGVKVEITDMSFDALLAAVQTGKVDVGICSIGAKEERKKMVDFSQMYHQALNTFAARNDSSIIINSVDDIVNYHVGAMSGSLEEQYLTELVDAGKMKDSQLSHYEKNEELYLDLVNGRIQVLAGGSGQTRQFMKIHPIKIVYEVSLYGTGENIALPKNQNELLKEVDRILDDLRKENFLANLDSKWDL